MKIRDVSIVSVFGPGADQTVQCRVQQNPVRRWDNRLRSAALRRDAFSTSASAIGTFIFLQGDLR